MGDTDIGWTHRPGTRGRSWNPVQGCSRKSEGCRNCFAERIAARFAESGWSRDLINLRTKKWNGVVRLAEHKLEDPLHWRDPSTIFVNSMSDLFHENLPDDPIDQVFAVMALASRHTYIVLTKRPDRMYSYITTPGRHEAWSKHLRRIRPHSHIGGVGEEWFGRFATHIWLGTSVENQEALEERYPHLMATPATLRLFSAEPLLGPLDFTHAFADAACRKGDLWVIDGCESGPGWRPAASTWFTSIEEQCRAAGVAYFHKQEMIAGKLVHDFPGRQEFPR